MLKHDRVAVLIPAFNEQGRLEKTLRSIEIQDGDIDIFVVDDGSSTAITLDQDNFRHNIRLIRLPKNEGIVKALNAGLKEILSGTYEYVARQDCGDVDVNDRIQRQVDFMKQNRSVAVLGAWVRFVDLHGSTSYVFRPPESDSEIRHRMGYSPAFIHPACMIRLSALREVGLYREIYPSAEDYDLFFRLLKRYDGANIPEILVESEVNPSGISIGRRRESLTSRLKLQMANFSANSLSAYLGFFTSLVLYLLPYSFVVKVKKMLKFVG